VVLGTWLAEVAVLPKWEALLALVAAVLVISMVIYMLKAAKHLRRDIGARLEAAAVRTGRGAWLGVFLFVVLMVTREGMETAFITASLFRQTDTAHFTLGAFGGLGLAAALAWAWVRYGQLVNLAMFFKVTSVFLVCSRFSWSSILSRGDRGEPFAARQRVLARGHRALWPGGPVRCAAHVLARARASRLAHVRGLENETRRRALTRLCQPAATGRKQPFPLHERRPGLSYRYAVLSVAALALSQPAVAGDSPFGYVYTADTIRGVSASSSSGSPGVMDSRVATSTRGRSAPSSSTALPTTYKRRCT